MTSPQIYPEIQIDLDAIVANWRRLEALSGAMATPVVKADGYGLGADRIAKALQHAGAEIFYVAYAFEGEALRKSLGAGPEIRVFHGVSPAEIDVFKSNDLTPVLNSLDQIQAWAAVSEGRKPVLHIDTGMNRLGLAKSDTASIAERIEPIAIMSHLACADDASNPMNARQLSEFLNVAQAFPRVPRSLSASAGALLGREYGLDEIRPGIGLHGGGPRPASGPDLTQAATLTAPILQIRAISPDETSGYGATFSPEAPAMLACASIGYADGLLRTGSNKGYAMVQGQRRPIVGRISMDLTMIDITGLDTKIGEPVVFFGPDLPIREQADAFGTIDYELLTSLGGRVKRTYTGGAAG
ncbi:MAG: alanine racemase [Pseudomonadota bacterium]